MSQRFIVKPIKMNKIASGKELANLFVFVATNYPNQANKLFKKYVSYICRHRYSLDKSRGIAAKNLCLLADSLGEKQYNLLLRTIPELRQH